jgi:hypothetical protein
MRVYLAGPMSDLPEYNADGFRKAARYAKAQGWTVFSPHDTKPSHGGQPCIGDPATWTYHRGLTHTYACWLAASMAEMVRCDALLMLPGWEDSRGARIEWDHAVKRGMVIYYLPEEN